MNDIVGVLRWRPNESEKLKGAWEAFVSWCAVRHIYVGGTSAAAVLYAPDYGLLMMMWKPVRKRARSMLSTGSLELSVCPMRLLPSLRTRRAALEAVVCAQDVLSQAMVTSVSSLAALASGSAVDFEVSVAADGRYLTARWIQRDIEFNVTRLDGAAEPAFYKWRGMAFEWEDLINFSSDWGRLSWRSMAPMSDLVGAGWEAQANPWLLSFTARPTTGLSDAQVLAAVQELLLQDRGELQASLATSVGDTKGHFNSSGN